MKSAQPIVTPELSFIGGKETTIHCELSGERLSAYIIMKHNYADHKDYWFMARKHL